MSLPELLRPLRIAPPPARTQPWLLELLPSGSLTPGATRAHAGRLMEEIVCRGLGLTQAQPDAKYDVCFDAHRSGLLFEIKSVRRHGKSPLYEWRLRKEQEAQAPVVYLFVEHNARGLRSLEEMAVKMAETAGPVYALTHKEVQCLTQDLPLRNIRRTTSQSRIYSGYDRAGYCLGYKNLSLKTVREVARHSGPSFSGALYGLPLNLTLSASAEARTLLEPVLGWV